MIIYISAYGQRVNKVMEACKRSICANSVRIFNRHIERYYCRGSIHNRAAFGQGAQVKDILWHAAGYQSAYVRAFC